MKKNPKTNGSTSEVPCFDCGTGLLLESDVDLTGERNGESFTVRMSGLRCNECGFATIDSTGSSEFTRLISDAYRKKHDLLTGSEIRERREQLRMSQQQFADYLGSVGVASVKRWELGQIQEKAMDALLRLKTDPEVARDNLKALELKVPEPCVLSSAVVDGQDFEFYVFLDQQQYRTPHPVKIEPSEEFSLIEGDDEPVAA